jgi:hypothetical protein
MLPACPKCGQAGVPLLFGLADKVARDAGADGLLALGGCRVGADPPNWQCPQRHRWCEADEWSWGQLLFAVLTAHGTSEPGSSA